MDIFRSHGLCHLPKCYSNPTRPSRHPNFVIYHRDSSEDRIQYVLVRLHPTTTLFTTTRYIRHYISILLPHFLVQHNTSPTHQTRVSSIQNNITLIDTTVSSSQHFTTPPCSWIPTYVACREAEVITTLRATVVGMIQLVSSRQVWMIVVSAHSSQWYD